MMMKNRFTLSTETFYTIEELIMFMQRFSENQKRKEASQ